MKEVFKTHKKSSESHLESFDKKRSGDFLDSPDIK